MNFWLILCQGRSTKGLLLGKLSRSGQRPDAWPERPFCWAIQVLGWCHFLVTSVAVCSNVSHAYTACFYNCRKSFAYNRLACSFDEMLVTTYIRSKDGGVLEDYLQFSFSVCKLFFGLQDILDAISKMAALEIYIKWPPPFSCGFAFFTKRLAVMPTFLKFLIPTYCFYSRFGL